MTSAPVCIACGSQDAEFALTKSGYDIFRCPKCDLRFVHPVPPEDQIAELYRDKSTCQYRLRPSFFRDLDRKMIASGIKRRTGGGKMLEIGCSRGDLVYAATQVKGLEPVGLDLDISPLKLASARGCSVVLGALENAPFPRESFDVIVAWHVLEHMTDPLRSLSAIRDLLKPNGWLAACFPSHAHFKARKAGENWHYYIPPIHLWYFSKPNFGLLCEKAGLKLKTASLFHYHAHMTAFAQRD